MLQYWILVTSCGPSCVKGRWGYPQDKLLLMDSIVHLLTVICWIAIYSVVNTICLLNNWALIFMQFLWIPCSIVTALHPHVHWSPFFVFVSLFVCFVFCSFVCFVCLDFWEPTVFSFFYFHLLWKNITLAIVSYCQSV